jgi:transposase
LSEIREDENGNGESRNWGKRGNKNRDKKLHGWEFDRFIILLEYKAEEHGILVDRKVSETPQRRVRVVLWAEA